MTIDPNQIGGNDIVAVFTQSDFTQVLTNANVMRVSPFPSAKVMEHPVEDGSMVTDHHIVNLMEIDVNILPQYGKQREIYNELYQMFVGGILLAIQTRTKTYTNMLVQGMPHDETADMLGTVPISIRFKEWRPVKASYAQIAYDGAGVQGSAIPQLSSTVDKGRLTYDTEQTNAVFEQIQGGTTSSTTNTVTNEAIQGQALSIQKKQNPPDISSISTVSAPSELSDIQAQLAAKQWEQTLSKAVGE